MRPERLKHLSAALAALALVAAASLQWSCGASEAAEGGPAIIVLGFDGLDPELTRKLMDEGRLPNFSRLAEQGVFRDLGTAVPPQSPVAWSDFITGLDSGGHGIYDFLHRDPETLAPYLSTSRALEADKTLEIGKWVLPLSGGGVELLRHGTPFWEVAEQHGHHTTIVRMPANFPPSGTASRELSGMGTPDALGTPGTFSFYTSELFYDEDVSGGEIFEAWPEDGVVHAQLHGPDNPFLKEPEPVTLDFQVHVDPEEPVVRLVVGDEQRILQVGEWTDWVPLQFELMPTQALPAMARFYLDSLEPEFQLYVSPLNFDPLHPAMPISHPEDFAAELAEMSGRYYTQGMPEDTKALENDILDREEFVEQARISRQEMVDQYRELLEEFRSGLLFYYMGSADQVSHMLWDTLDPTHPAYDEAEDAPFADVIPTIYEELDQMVGYTLENMPPDTLLVVMSDHGFASWKRSVNLNSWLRDEGYIVLKDPTRPASSGYFGNVDWSRTRAYGVGINALYVNVEGREKNGIVPPSEKDALLEEIGAKLLALQDPEAGGPAVTKVYTRDEYFRDRGHLEIGPDMVVGYAEGYRASGKSALGEIAEEVFKDNLDEWPGDHLMDHEAVPGVLFTNRPLKESPTTLQELAGALLVELGIEGFPAPEGDG